MAGIRKDVELKNQILFNSKASLIQSEHDLDPLASWFATSNKMPHPSKSYNHSNMLEPDYQELESHSDLFEHLRLPLTPSVDSYALAQSFEPKPRNGCGPSASGMNGWYAFSTDGRRSLSNDFQDGPENSLKHMDLDTLIQAADVSDGTTHSQRMSSTPSKTSGFSSHTSAGPSFTGEEMEEHNVISITRKPSSPASSISSQLSPAKSTTPANLLPPVKTTPSKPRKKSIKPTQLRFADLRPRTTIPLDYTHAEIARQSIHAAYSSRLNPFALHPNEYLILRDHICHLHVSAYLNIRNRILRLWVRNPLVSVTAEEAAGCALSSRWLGLAEVAYEWLIRKGYINFGCVEIPDTSDVKVKKLKTKRPKRKTMIIVGAGMAGLGCARQLEGLFSHYREKWISVGEEPPKVVVLEGRGRLGGRVYSHPLKIQSSSSLSEPLRCTAEMGAHIITGFDHGNPLNMIIRGQLALHYYPLKDNSTLFDLDGQVVDKTRDIMVEKLFNDILDRASVYRNKVPTPATIEGTRELIEAGRDPTGEGGNTISEMENEQDSAYRNCMNDNDNGVEHVPGGLDRLTGKAPTVPGSRIKVPPAVAAEAMGWRLASSVLAYQDLNLDVVAKSAEFPTLGAAMDEAVKQYQFLLDLSPQDMRMLNWHYANLEYANAVNVDKLSLSGWDQDIGNEFEGEHAQVIGGYQQVPRAIWQYPSKLDLRTRKVVKQIDYDKDDILGGTAKVLCEDGDILEADRVVLTTPLGVLKDNTIAFSPNLPEWKLEAIDRLGFGTLNKVVLVYEEAFWNIDQDMFGLLREAEVSDSLDQEDYVSNRGRFYLFWNCIKTSGRPVLIALMAGDAAHQAESLGDADLVSEVTQQLALMFKQKSVPQPLETIVTRWGNDRFARGTYSYVGSTSQPGDYDAMARPVGNLHFAGEATCGTHPATVHGAYISGLRAASEVIDSLLGPIEIPSPLVPIAVRPEPSPRASNSKRKAESPALDESEGVKQARLESFESEILKAIFDELGFRPSKPGKRRANPFLLYTKDKWAICKQVCDDARRAATGNAEAKASKGEVRGALGLMWRQAPEDVKRPYLEQTSSNRLADSESVANFEDRLMDWDAQAMGVRRKYIESHPGVLSSEEEREMWQALDGYGSERRAKKISGYAEESGTDVDV